MTARRCQQCHQLLPEYGGMVLDDERRTVHVGMLSVRLTPRECDVLRFLLNKRGGVARREAIWDWLYQLTDEPEGPMDRILDLYICKLRKKLKPLGVRIGTAWGLGYYLLAA